MYLSNIIFIILYLFDVTIGYRVGGYIGALVIAIILPVGIFIQMRLTLLFSGVTKLEHLNLYDKNRLAIAFERVLQNGESRGFSFNNPKIYLSEEDCLNAFCCGKAIVINRPVMDSGCLEAVIAHEVKHFKYNDSYTACLLCNTIMVFFSAAMLILNVYIFAIALVIGIIIAAVVRKSEGILIGGLIFGILRRVKNLILRMLLFLMQAMTMLLSRYCEFKADEFAVCLGYADQLKQFLRLTANDNRRWSSGLAGKLLESHPSEAKRIANIQKLQNQMDESREEDFLLPFRM